MHAPLSRRCWHSEPLVSAATTSSARPSGRPVDQRHGNVHERLARLAYGHHPAVTDPSLARQPTICPTCRARLQPHAGFVTWCPACGWNAAPSARPEVAPEGRLERLEQRLATAAGTHLFEQLRGRPITARLDPESGGGAAAGRRRSPGHVGGGRDRRPCSRRRLAEPVVDLRRRGGAGHRVAPAPSARPSPAQRHGLRRSAAPHLFALLDRVSAGAGGRQVDLVVLEPGFSAWHSVLGLRRQHVLGLGLPLWAALSPAGERGRPRPRVGHAVNGDVRRGILVGSALGALAEWHDAFDTDGPILNLVLAPIRAAIAGLILVEVKLLMHSSQRGEYLADAISARVASTDAAVNALDKTMGTESIMLGVRRAAYRADAASTDIRTVVAERVAAIPAIEWARLRRAAETMTHQVDTTHPPSRLRQQLMESRPREPGTVTLDSAEVRAINRELDPYVPELQRQGVRHVHLRALSGRPQRRLGNRRLGLERLRVRDLRRQRGDSGCRSKASTSAARRSGRPTRPRSTRRPAGPRRTRCAVCPS